MKHFLYKDLGLPTRTKQRKVTTDEDALRSLLAYSKGKHDALKTESAKLKYLRAFVSIMLVLQIRAVRKDISSYIDVEHDSDGRLRSTLSIGGTSTFRFSSSKTLWDTGLNLQTVPRKLRDMFLADEGYELAEYDLNRGESWIYSHLAHEPRMMDIHQSGGDFHTVTACAISSVFGQELNLEDWADFAAAEPERAYKLRFLGKKTNHASAYRMGPFRFQEVVNEEADNTGLTITVAQAKRAQFLWKQEYRYIERWWKEIETQLNQDRTMTTPYGRRQTFYDNWGDELFKMATAYVPQSTSVDYCNGGLLRCWQELDVPNKYGVQLLHQNHDSIVLQYREGYRDKVMPAVVELVESELKVAGHDLIIPVEAQYGRSWGELTEYASAA